MARGSLLALLACAALPVRADQDKLPLPVYLEDDHAGTLPFLASVLDLEEPHVLVLVDAHPDSSVPRTDEDLARGIRRVATPEERDARISVWRRDGTIQSFDWIAPLMPAPVAKVVWVRLPDAGGERSGTPSDDVRLPPGFSRSTLDELETLLPRGMPVVASIDLDAFSGLPPVEQAARFASVWSRLVRLPRLAALSFAVSRPWLADDAEASRLVLLALDASLSLAHAVIRFEPYGIEGPDRSRRAKTFYAAGREPPRYDPETASSELRSLLLASVERLDVRLDPSRWKDLIARWRVEDGGWRLVLDGVDAAPDGVVRPGPGATPALQIVGARPAVVRGVTWLAWTPAAWSYNVLPELPTGKVFAGAAPPVVSYRTEVLARTEATSLPAERWLAAFPGPGRSGVLRISAQIDTPEGVVRTAPLQLRRAVGTGFHAGLSEQFGLPYVFGAGFLRRGGLRGPDTGVGNDCANFLVAAWRRSGHRLPWSNPGQLRRHLVPLATGVRASDRVSIPPDAVERGLVVHLGSHVAALWEDRAPLGTLGPEDTVAHHLGGPPEVITLDALLAPRAGRTFDLYVGPGAGAPR
jgi:hypothetical protein